jgi:methionyl aminopeptidase
VGLPSRQIGSIIAETIASFGLKAIRNLSGHGLGHYQIHTMPTIPNYDDQSKGIIQAGMTFAIEPFATNGKGLIYESSHPTIFCFQHARPVKSPHAKALLVKIYRFQGLPFSLHDVLSEELSLLETKQALNELIALQVIAGYPPLIEEGRGKVAQAENSVLVDLDGSVLITTRESHN